MSNTGQTFHQNQSAVEYPVYGELEVERASPSSVPMHYSSPQDFETYRQFPATSYGTRSQNDQDGYTAYTGSVYQASSSFGRECHLSPSQYGGTEYDQGYMSSSGLAPSSTSIDPELQIEDQCYRSNNNNADARQSTRVDDDNVDEDEECKLRRETILTCL